MLGESWKLSASTESFIENLVSAKDKHSPCSLDSFHPARRELSKQLAVSSPARGQVCVQHGQLVLDLSHIPFPRGLAQHNGPPGW